MTTSHWIQTVLAGLAAAASAVAPLLPAADVIYDSMVSVACLAVAHVLSQQSETKGDAAKGATS